MQSFPVFFKVRAVAFSECHISFPQISDYEFNQLVSSSSVFYGSYFFQLKLMLAGMSLILAVVSYLITVIQPNCLLRTSSLFRVVNSCLHLDQHNNHPNHTFPVSLIVVFARPGVDTSSQVIAEVPSVVRRCSNIVTHDATNRLVSVSSCVHPFNACFQDLPLLSLIGILKYNVQTKVRLV